MPNDGGRSPAEVVVIGVPGSRRVAAFTDAARRFGIGRVDVVSYLDCVAGRCAAPRPGTLVRIESPSECFETTRAILKAGIGPVEAGGKTPVSESEIDRLVYCRGEMLHPRQWFLGYRRILQQLNAAWGDAALRWTARPEAIVTAFDKLACLDLWTQAGLPVPRRFPGVDAYGRLRREIPDRRARVFVKLRYGYSAMGAAALEWRGSLVRAITTMEAVWEGRRLRLFVNKRPRVLTREFEIARLINTLAREEILVEDWLPKARWNGKPYDVRVVMIGGRAHHVVGRANGSPFTNLNLDATRIPRETIESELGVAWGRFETLCEQAAGCIPGAAVLGLDVLVRPCRGKFALLEANAFGDYLPGLTHRGRSVYETELSAFYPAAGGAA